MPWDDLRLRLSVGGLSRLRGKWSGRAAALSLRVTQAATRQAPRLAAHFQNVRRPAGPPHMPRSILVRHYDKVLLKEADLAVSRARRARSLRNKVIHGAASYTAIVASAGAAEAYLSEVLAHLERTGTINATKRNKIRREDRLWKRFQALVLTFSNLRLSTLPIYREFQALVTLRNCLVHRSADFVPPGRWPSKLDSFKSEIPHVRGRGLDWTSQVLDADTAGWARRLAKRFLATVRSMIPDPTTTLRPGA